MSKILVVEDEEHLAAGLRFNLEADGHEATTADSGEAAFERLQQGHDFELVLLDVMLPGQNGFEVVRRMRRQGDFTPVMMLTSRGRAEDVLEGFEAGADDYLPKPFDLDILLARIGGLLRRREWMRKSGGGPEAEPELERYEIGDRVVDFEAQRIEWNGETRPLTLMETNLLRYLTRNEGRTVSRKALLEEVWGVREDTDTRAVDNFIVRLRRYLEPEPSKPRHLLTVRGVGYRLLATPENDSPSS